MATDISRPSTYSDESRQLYLAYWYERLARHLLNAKTLSYDEWMKGKGLSSFDLHSDTLFSYVEIKGSSNMDQMKLFVDQLETQLGEIGFPFDSGFIWIFSYRNSNKIDGVTTRLLKKNGKTPDKVDEFLSRQTNVVFAIDIYLLNAWRRKNGSSQYTRDAFNPREIIPITRTELRGIAKTARSSLEDLGLVEDIPQWLPPRAKQIPSRFVKTEMDGLPIKFELILLLPNALKIRLLKQINGVVRRA